MIYDAIKYIEFSFCIYSTNKLHPIGHSIRLIFQRINSSLSGDLIIIDFTAVHCVQKRRGKKKCWEDTK